jgi:uncharacterized protein
MRRRKGIVLSVFLLALSRLPIEAQNSPAASTKQPVQQQGVAPSAQPAAKPKIDPAKEANIRKLLDITGARGLAVQSMDAMMKSIKPLLANSLPPGDYREKVIDLFVEKFRAKADSQQIVDLVVPIYDKHLSDEEIKGLIAFYQTPLGKKALSVLPEIALESRQAGEEWGKALGGDCMREVLAEHPDLANAMEAASKNGR